MTNAIRTLYLSHGGGPLPLLGDPNHREMVTCLTGIAAELPKPAAIVVISAHWEEPVVAITAAPSPPLVYDYYGFPEESYRIQYPCPGDPALAEALNLCLTRAGIPSRLDTQRGFDHGLFVPLKIMYPDADIPCLQLSLAADLDAALHLRIGEALRGLTRDNLLVIGSGFSFHNMKAFFSPDDGAAAAKNQEFEHWLIDTLANRDLSEDERRQRLIQWATAPHARYCHPREEHLLPLHVCYGLAGRPCERWFTARILNKQSSMYLW